jgi:hypothetical protein
MTFSKLQPGMVLHLIHDDGGLDGTIIIHHKSDLNVEFTDIRESWWGVETCHKLDWNAKNQKFKDYYITEIDEKWRRYPFMTLFGKKRGVLYL